VPTYPRRLGSCSHHGAPGCRTPGSAAAGHRADSLGRWSRAASARPSAPAAPPRREYSSADRPRRSSPQPHHLVTDADKPLLAGITSTTVDTPARPARRPRGWGRSQSRRVCRAHRHNDAEYEDRSKVPSRSQSMTASRLKCPSPHRRNQLETQMAFAAARSMASCTWPGKRGWAQRMTTA